MQRTLSLLLLLALLNTAWSLRCLPCERRTCSVPSCSTGLVKDVCRCCDVCAKAEGERCGGPWNMRGTCDTGLTCYKERRPGDSRNDIFNRTGVCRPSRG